MEDVDLMLLSTMNPSPEIPHSVEISAPIYSVRTGDFYRFSSEPLSFDLQFCSVDLASSKQVSCRLSNVCNISIGLLTRQFQARVLHTNELVFISKLFNIAEGQQKIKDCDNLAHHL
ncbi:unnamed protein product [Dicrocoelium dendriticum]|nr:unnamed protein product [Dicrocoelium dendriticum]